MSTGIQTAQAAGLVPDSRVLDIRGVDLVRAQILENEVPVFVVAFHTQEILCYRNPKNGQVVMGADDRVKNCGYVVIITRLEAELDNEETGGWKIIDVRPVFVLRECSNADLCDRADGP